MRRLLAFLGLIVITQIAAAAPGILIPGGELHLNVTNPDKNYADVVLHSVLITPETDEALVVSGVKLDLLSRGRVVLSKSLPIERLIGETQGIAEMVAQGMEVFLNAQILSIDGLEGLYGKKMNFASSGVLASNEILLLTRQHFSVDFSPDELRVTVYGSNEQGADRTFSTSAQVENHESRVSYSTPLRGAWLMTSLPSIQSHHRLNPPTEFAVDFFKTTAEGSIHEGEALDASNFPGYGAPVTAAADGEVVFVIADEVQDRAAYLPKAGESPDETGARISRHNMRRYVSDFGRAAAGNIVTIRHEVDGVTEYSSYGHLKAGSVRVAVGDIVTRGQVIGEVGDTGDSAAVHLHFQINAGENAFMSKSLPVVFSDQESVVRGVDAGRFVKKSD